jgi:V/A-type H+-transporting ATPase subunit D
MATIKLTKTELKKQRDGLKQFRRYLPTLQLKKQQLQMEVQRARDARVLLETEKDDLRRRLGRWSRLLVRPEFAWLEQAIRPSHLETAVRNVAGVDVPVFVSLSFDEDLPDLFTTPLWLDAAAEALRKLLELRLRGEILEQQQQRLEDELRTTTQRVNLFEKVKIPQCRENIRVIGIYLGDQQTAAVGRSKIAKRKFEGAEPQQGVAS